MTFPGGLAATPDPPHGGPGRAAGGPGKAPGTQGDPGGRRGVRGAAGPPGTVWLMLAADSCKTWRFLVCSRAGFSFVPVPQAPGPGPRASGPGPGPRAPGLGPGPRPTARSPGPGPGPGARGPGPKARYRLQIASQDFFWAFQDNHIMIIIDLARALALAGLLALVMGSHCNGKHTSKLEPDLFWTGVSFSGFP